MIQGERLGLVGRNGCGKSTLLKMILGIESPDAGSITAPRGYRIGHLAQHLEFTEENILKEACLGLPEDERDQEYRGEIILGGLGFSEEDLLRPPSAFSGGFQIRINLAKLLLSEPNLLLLDEPTNYLDILSMRWLTTFLQSWRGELIIISHDRLFMDGVTTHTMLIHRGSIRKMKGPTAKLYEQVQTDEEIYEKTRINEDKKRKELEQFINRFRAQASKAALVQSKMLALERMGKKEELQDEETLDFQFCNSGFPGKIMAELRDVSFAYPGGPDLVSGLSLTLNKGDRIGIIGKNGKGKSTLLRLIANELSPKEGSVTMNQNVGIGYFGQTNISRLDPKRTVEDEIFYSNSKLHRTKIRAICGTMMFSGDDALKKVSVLSGGEKSRVLLGKILAEPTNLLLLDEPSNHLDMESIEALIESLKDYEGGVIFVTHSELILRELATRLIVFQGDTPYLFDHDYSYFLEKVGWGDSEEMTSSSTSKSKVKNEKNNNINAVESQHDKEKIRAKNLKKIAALEENIYKMEASLVKVEEDLALAYQYFDEDKVRELTDSMERLQKNIEEGMSNLDRLSKEAAA